MVEKNIPFDPDFQSIFDEAIAFLFKETLTEPGWKGISHLFESECYDEVLNGLICTLVDLEGLADSEFNDQYLSEYLDEGEKINNKKEWDLRGIEFHLRSRTIALMSSLYTR